MKGFVNGNWLNKAREITDSQTLVLSQIVLVYDARTIVCLVGQDCI